MLFCIVTLESKQFNAPYTALGKAYTFSKQLPIKCMRYLIILHFLLHLFRPNKTIVERKLKTCNQIKTNCFEYCKTFPRLNEVCDNLVWISSYKKALLESTIKHCSGRRAWYNISAMVFSLNVDYIRSNRGMIVTAEAVSIFILSLSGF